MKKYYEKIVDAVTKEETLRELSPQESQEFIDGEKIASEKIVLFQEQEIQRNEVLKKLNLTEEEVKLLFG